MSVILIYGENEFEASEFYIEMLASFVAENSQQSLNIFDGETTSVEQIEEALSAQSLFSSGYEMIAVKRLGNNTELKDRLGELIGTVPDNTRLVIYEPKIDKRSKLYKLLNKSNSAKEFKSLSDGELVRWISNRIEGKDGKIENGAAQYLIKRVKGDQLRLSNEINKLVSYDKTISLETINLLIDEAPDANVFDLLNFVMHKNKEKALAKYDELRGAQVDAHYILVMLCWQMSNLMSVQAAKSRSDKEIASQLGMNPYSVGKTRQLVRGITSREMRSMSKKLMRVDTEIKTTSVDTDQILKQLIVEL